MSGETDISPEEWRSFVVNIENAELDLSVVGPVVDALSSFMERKAKTLDSMAEVAVMNLSQARLQGKAQGVRLAISYLEQLKRTGVLP